MKTAEEIQKLHDLKQQGILSDQEFQDAKEKLLRAENTQQAQFNPTLTPNWTAPSLLV